MLRDRIKIKLRSGQGGPGSHATHSNRPYGGDGGDGGDVYLEGSTHVYDLGGLEHDRTYAAKDGKPGNKINKKGARGDDLVVKLPLLTEVWDGDKLITSISEHGQKVKLLDGGLGGYGNTSLKKAPHFLPQQNQQRMQASEVAVDLVLKLQSDVIFIGYPNAGKSSMLNALTNARVKTASYAFTTLDPQIGLMDGLRLMDLPGLIEDTHKGKGLGIKFAKHTEHSRLILHFVPLDTPEPVQSYQTMRHEIRQIGFGLDTKDEIIVLSKSDEVDDIKLNKVLNDFANMPAVAVIPTSIADDDSVKRLKDVIKNYFAV